MTQSPTIACLIMAAGTAARFGAKLPKQYCLLGGMPVLRHTINAYLKHPQINNVQVVIHPEHLTLYQEAVTDLDLPAPAYGAATRPESVRSGLRALQKHAPDYVLIVDAARPLIDADTITRVIAALTPDSGAIAALPVTDTLKKSASNFIDANVPRDNLWQAQTPQAFPFQAIHDLHEKHQGTNVTDDAALFELAGLPVKLVMGHRNNFKITTQDDLEMAEKLLAQKIETRIGHGYDVHRFTDGDHVWLGGIKIPHNRGVEAHSDGDLILDAVTDALLGTIGAGDIGQHFPPSDPQWKDASSDRFVKYALDKVIAKQGRIINVDITVHAEAPKIGPHRDAIRENVAALLTIENLRVNIKAKTGEKMGYVGRAEGLAADAVIAIEFPYA